MLRVGTGTSSLLPFSPVKTTPGLVTPTVSSLLLFTVPTYWTPSRGITDTNFKKHPPEVPCETPVEEDTKIPKKPSPLASGKLNKPQPINFKAVNSTDLPRRPLFHDLFGPF